MQTPDPEFVDEGENEVEITDLVSPTRTDKVQKRFADQSKVYLFRTRTWMSLAIIAGIALLAFTVLLNVSHVPKSVRVTVQPVQINYPVSLSEVDGICYANAPNGVVTAFRVRDGVLIWRHMSKTKSEESATMVDGVIYLTPILPNGSYVTSMTVEALRARDGISLWSRSFPTDSPETFQLTVVNKVVYERSAAGRIDALRATDGSLLWHFTSGVPFVSLPTVPALQLLPPILFTNGVVYTGTLDGHLYALRASDGILLWSYTPHTAYRQLLPVVENDIVLIALQDGSVEALRASSGLLLWRRAMNS